MQRKESNRVTRGSSGSERVTEQQETAQVVKGSNRTTRDSSGSERVVTEQQETAQVVKG
jgi:hypothetical protein